MRSRREKHSGSRRPDTQGYSFYDVGLSDISSIHPVNYDNNYETISSTVLLQHFADPNIRNTDGKMAVDLADPSAKAVLTGKAHVFTPTRPGSWFGVVVSDRGKRMFQDHIGQGCRISPALEFPGRRAVNFVNIIWG